jgi:ketosteroid isomerase-like protein
MSAEQDLMAIDARRRKAMVEADAVALGEILADDLIYTHSNAAIDNKKSYIEGIVNKRWAYTGAEQLEAKIQIAGDTAWIIGHVRLTLSNADGSSRTVNARFLNVWLRRGGPWQMVAWQSTPIPA